MKPRGCGTLHGLSRSFELSGCLAKSLAVSLKSYAEVMGSKGLRLRDWLLEDSGWCLRDVATRFLEVLEADDRRTQCCYHCQE